MKTIRARATVALGLVSICAVSFANPAPALQSGEGAQRSEVRIPIGNFSLTDQAGRPFRLESKSGKIIVAEFVYTSCPDLCPLMTAALRTVQTNLKPSERSRVYFLTVTTDPEVDAPQVLAAYAKRYRADLDHWAFLTGNEAALKPVWKAFGVRVVRKARGLIDHTALTAIMDGSAIVRVAYHGAAPDPKLILRDVRALLASKQSLDANALSTLARRAAGYGRTGFLSLTTQGLETKLIPEIFAIQGHGSG